MNQYELAVLLHPDLEIDIDKPLKKISKLTDDAGAKVKSSDNWGKRKLAYPVKGLNFAVYVFYRLELDPAKVADLEGGLKLADEVIRHLLIKLAGEELGPAASSRETETKPKPAPANKTAKQKE